MRLALLALIAIQFASPAFAQLFEGTISLDPNDLSLNRLEVRSTPGGATLLAYESTGVVLSDRIELRLNADLTFTAVSTPANWQVQSTIINDAGVQMRVVTYYFTGTDPGNSGEYFDFATPWQGSFRTSDPGAGSPGTDPLTTSLAVEVNSSTVIPGIGIIPVSASLFLAASLTSPTTQQPFSYSVEGGDPAGPTLRFGTALPGILNGIETTETLQSWSKRTTFTTSAPHANHPLPLGGGWKPHEFFRLLLIPVDP